MSKPRKEACYGCVHHRYHGPLGILLDEDVEDPGGPGYYWCTKFNARVALADRRPIPITSTCKETR